MPVDIRLHAVLIQQWLHLRDQLARVAVRTPARLDCMMSEYELPCGVRAPRFSVESREFSRRNLRRDIGRDRSVHLDSICVDKRRRVDEEHVDTWIADRVAWNLVVAAPHPPAAAGYRIVGLRLRRSAIIVVAEDGIPWRLERAIGVDVLKRCRTLRIVHALDAALVEIVPGRDREPAVGGMRKSPFVSC